MGGDFRCVDFRVSIFAVYPDILAECADKVEAIVTCWQTGVFTSSPVLRAASHQEQMRARRVPRSWIRMTELDSAGLTRAQRGTGRRPPVCVDRYPMGFGRRPRGRVQALAQASTLGVGSGSADADSESR